jgi:hypothetical protein
MRLEKDRFAMAPTMIERIVDLPPPCLLSALSPFSNGLAALPTA